MNDISFWDNKEEADNVINELSSLKKIIEPIKELKKKIEDNIETLNIITDGDQELYDLINSEVDTIRKELEELSINMFLNGEHDKSNCFLELHAGAGGTESCDWANMLLRMYTRYARKKGYTVEEIDMQDGDGAGIKSGVIMIKGINAYGYLKGESGIHRLVRISPFDSGARRHTSFASVEVIPEIDKKIDVEINDIDLKIDVYRSSGAGGQSVNTTDSAVRITHLPSKIVVTSFL